MPPAQDLAVHADDGIQAPVAPAASGAFRSGRAGSRPCAERPRRPQLRAWRRWHSRAILQRRPSDHRPAGSRPSSLRSNLTSSAMRLDCGNGIGASAFIPKAYAMLRLKSTRKAVRHAVEPGFKAPPVALDAHHPLDCRRMRRVQHADPGPEARQSRPREPRSPPSTIFSAMPRPFSGTIATKTASAPPFNATRPPMARISSVQARPSPATSSG